MIKILSILSIVLFITACHLPKGDIETRETFHENGNKAVYYEYNKEIDGGLYREFYPNGNLQIERNIMNGEVQSEKIIDINGKILVNYVIREGEYYGLLGSASCFNVFSEDKLTVVE